MTRRGDVVVAVFPYVGGGAGKHRPTVVVQCDRLNGQIDNTIVAMVTGNTRLVGKDPAQFLIDPGTPEGRSSGLAYRSAVKYVPDEEGDGVFVVTAYPLAGKQLKAFRRRRRRRGR